MFLDTSEWTATRFDVAAFVAAATEVGVGFCVRFYEHPTRGDEAPIYALKDGVIWNTHDFDIPA